MLNFLEINGINISSSNEDVIELGLKTADGTFKHKEILDWILNHKSI